MRIMIVEDDDTSRSALLELLASEGHDLVAVATGKDAVRALGDERPDLLILDYRLPDMTGLEILARVVAELDGRLLPPALLVTGHRLSARARAAASDLGARIVRKPVSPRELLFKVKAAGRDTV